MQKINFQNLPSTATPINATNLNAIQENAETAINLKADQDYIDGTKPMGNIVVDSIRSKNMLSGWFAGSVDSTNGSLINVTDARRTDYIEIDFTKSSQYMLSGLNIRNCSLLIGAYNSSKQFLGRTGAMIQSGATSVTITSSIFTSGTPQGTGDVKYLIITLYSPASGYTIDGIISSSSIQLEEGSTATDYAPYQGLGYASGSNANGNYIKYDDGTLICWNRVVVSSIAINSAEGSLYKSDNITPFPDYPISFIDSPSLSMESISDNGPRWFWIVKSQGDGSQRIRGIRLFSATSQTLSNAKLSYIAIGRWK